MFLSVCTPLGFVRLFGVVGQVLVKPHLLRDVDEEYHAFYLEEASVKRKLENAEKSVYNGKSANHYTDIKAIPTKFVSLAESFLYQRRNGTKAAQASATITTATTGTSTRNQHNLFYSEHEIERLHERLRELKSERKELDKLRSSTPLQRNLMYPLAMLLLLVITGMTVLIVVMNSLELLIGIKALPLSTRVRFSKYYILY